MENGVIESHNGGLSDDCLNTELSFQEPTSGKSWSVGD